MAAPPITDHDAAQRALRRKRLWTAADFAAFLGADVTPRQAREMLKRWDEESGGRLLEVSRGTNRRYTFAPARLLKLHPELFDRIVSLEERVDELEEGLGEARAHLKRLGGQVGQNSRDIAKHNEQLQLFRRPGVRSFVDERRQASTKTAPLRA